MTLDEIWAAPAYLSDCRRYRYSLRRDLETDLATEARWPVVLWIMLNPSTADETEDDPTIRRCMGFSRAWGASRLYVVNLFAFRATSPAELKAEASPVDETIGSVVNDFVIGLMAKRTHAEGGAVVVAWGSHGGHRGRSDYIRRMWERSPGLRPVPLLCLKRTAAGEPGHPLYLPKTAEPVVYYEHHSNHLATASGGGS